MKYIALLIVLTLPAIAHAERVSTGRIEYPLRYNINPDEGTVEFWMQPHFDVRPLLPAENFQGICAPITLSGSGGGLNTSYMVGSLWGADKAGWQVRFSPRAKMLPMGHAVTMIPGQWHHFAVTWKGKHTRFYFDGKQVSQRLHPASFSDVLGKLIGKPALPDGSFHVGERWNVGANFTVDDLRLSWIEREPDELGFHGALEIDPYTAVLDRFDGEGVTRKGQYSHPVKILDGIGGAMLNPGMQYTEGRFGTGLNLAIAEAPKEPVPAPLDVKFLTPEPIWQRLPSIGIPLTQAPPTIDGTRGTREWFCAASINVLLDEQTGLAGDDLSIVQFAHDGERLYAAFQFDRPSHNQQPSDKDLFELRLGGDKRITITANLAGLIDDAPGVQYAARVTDTGWEGELSLPLSLVGTSRDTLQLNVARIERTPQVRTWRWSYLGRFPPAYQNDGRAALLDEPIAVTIRGGWLERYHDAGAVALVSNFTDEPKHMAVNLSLYRGAWGVPPMPAVEDQRVDDLGQPTDRDVDEVWSQVLSTCEPVDQRVMTYVVDAQSTRMFKLTHPDEPGDYIAAVQLPDDLGAMTIPFHVPQPLGLDIQAFLLTGAMTYDVNLRRMREQMTDDSTLTLSLLDKSGGPMDAVRYDNLAQRDMVAGAFRQQLSPGTQYTVRATLRTGDEVLAHRDAVAATPATEQLPDWWTMDHGRTPIVPPPWKPIRVGGHHVEVLLRTYKMTGQALPWQVTVMGQDILAGPISLEGDGVPAGGRADTQSLGPDAALSWSMIRYDETTIKVSNRIEFDGFMLIDISITGESIDDLTLNIPIKAEYATLMQNYYKAPGPGERVGRYTGEVQDRYTSPPFITQWIGTDHLGLELSMESTRGWAMSDPMTAIEVVREDDVVTLRAKLIDKPVKLDKNAPRTIRLGLVATPTKTIMPHLAKARFYDDVAVALLPYDWAGFPAWHPPMTDEKRIAKRKAWVQKYHERGQKLLVNGGWAVSVQDEKNAPWVHEMFRRPMRNVSYSGAQQYAHCWNSPMADFMADSFAHNAAKLGFDGIRFDTVTPGYTCESLAHDCGWYDDDGNLWPSYGIFAQREAWKRLYRTFHGGVIDNGIIYTPNASGPIMAVHSFSDHHEIGEGYYQKADSLKKGYPPNMVRAVMTGAPYGFVTGGNLKMGPLFFNNRIGALIVNGAEPRFLDSRNWGVGYAPHKAPAVNIWDAWDWIDRYNAQWRGWWENDHLATVDSGDDMVLASLHVQQGRRVLLTVTNYEKQPMNDLPVKLNLANLGLTSPVYAEDAVTLEPVDISADGAMAIDVLSERYRLIKISGDVPRYAPSRLGPNLVTGAPAEIDGTWHSEPVDITPGAQYVLSAEVNITDTLGADSKTPNHMGRFSPRVRHFVSLGYHGGKFDGVSGVGRRSGEGYKDDPFYRRSFTPQRWTPTGGWTRIFLPLRASDTTESTSMVVSIPGGGKARVRNMAMHRVVD